MMNLWHVIERPVTTGPDDPPRKEILYQIPYATVDLTPKPPPAQTPIEEAKPQPQAQSQQPDRTASWKSFLESLKDPMVYGPLMTFIQASTVPLRPGETLGSRMLYASSLAGLHKQLLQENAEKLPMQKRREELEMQDLEARVAKNKVMAQVASAFELKKTQAEVERLIQEGRLREAEALQKQIDAELDRQYGSRQREASIRNQLAQAAMYDRLPAQGGGRGGKQEKLPSSQEVLSYRDYLMNQYDQLIGIPWAQAKQREPELTFDEFLQKYGKQALFNYMRKNIEEFNSKYPQYMLQWGQATFTPQGRAVKGSKPQHEKEITLEEFLRK